MSHTAFDKTRADSGGASRYAPLAAAASRNPSPSLANRCDAGAPQPAVSTRRRPLVTISSKHQMSASTAMNSRSPVAGDGENELVRVALHEHVAKLVPGNTSRRTQTQDAVGKHPTWLGAVGGKAATKDVLLAAFLVRQLNLEACSHETHPHTRDQQQQQQRALWNHAASGKVGEVDSPVRR